MMVVLGRFSSAGTMGALTRVGNASYSIYLTHPLVILLAAAAAPIWVAVSRDLMLAIIAGSALCLGIMVHHLVERPLLRSLMPGRLPQDGPSRVPHRVHTTLARAFVSRLGAISYK
jgi:peptidoglycan/LPS O-acetylase OafA/YrhL